jgi:hypothetical protein
MKSATTLSKIDNSPRYKAIPDPRHYSDQDRLVSSREKNTGPTQGPVRFRGIHNISASLNPSNKIAKIFAAVNDESHQWTQMLLCSGGL